MPVHPSPSSGAPALDPDVVASQVLQSAKYRWLDPGFVRRLAGAEAPRARSARDVIKRTKRRLHQVCGAYSQDVRPEAALLRLAAAAQAGDDALRQACLGLMSAHAATRERIPVLDRFYRDLFARTGTPRVIIDLACGLCPLAWPWMGLPPATRYLAYDVDARLVTVVDGFLSLCGVPHVAHLRDVASSPPEEPADVALLLKAMPCLDQQAPGAARGLLERLRAPWLVVTYPVHSLGGAAKGMARHYRARFTDLISGLGWQATELRYPSELVFIVQRDA